MLVRSLAFTFQAYISTVNLDGETNLKECAARQPGSEARHHRAGTTGTTGRHPREAPQAGTRLTWPPRRSAVLRTCCLPSRRLAKAATSGSPAPPFGMVGGGGMWRRHAAAHMLAVADSSREAVC